MTPCTSAQAAVQTETVPASVRDLPDAVLTHALGFLDLPERQRAALTCRRFAALACSPELLRRLGYVDLCGLDGLTSFQAFLTRHGRHVQQLSLSASGEGEEADGSVAAATTACLEAAGAAGQLTALAVWGTVGNTEWLASMRSLQALTLQPLDSMPPLAPAVGLLTALRELELFGSASVLAPATRLPSSITDLRICCSDQETMPQQVARLPALRRLTLHACSYSDASMGGLSALSGSLTRLTVGCRAALPSSISALSQLQHLQLTAADHDDADQLNNILASLQHLTCLVLRCGTLPGLPPAVRQLGRLRLLYFTTSAEAGKQPLPPPGPWLQQLEVLATNAEVLISSSPVLAAAPRLKDVVVATVPKPGTDAFYSCWSGPAWHAFWAWATEHPSLSTLSFAPFAYHSAQIWQPFNEAVIQIHSKRPALTVMRDCQPFYRMLKA